MSYEKEQKLLIEKLKQNGFLSTPVVEAALRDTPRHLFIPDEHRRHAYEDQPIPLINDQTISAPHMVSLMSELAEISEGMELLEVGTGSGYQAAILSKIVGSGNVYTIERHKKLFENARKTIEGCGITNVSFYLGDGTYGVMEKAPFDRIIITAATPKIPKPLIAQTRDGGKIIAPIGSKMIQRLIRATVENGKIASVEDFGGCVFVPLLGDYGFKSME